MTTYQIRFYHSGDYENNQSEEYLHNGAFHAEYSSLRDARSELDQLGSYYYDHGNLGRYEFDENGKIVGWTYSGLDLTWGMRYWIVKVDTPRLKSRDLSQTALDYVAPSVSLVDGQLMDYAEYKTHCATLSRDFALHLLRNNNDVLADVIQSAEIAYDFGDYISYQCILSDWLFYVYAYPDGTVTILT